MKLGSKPWWQSKTVWTGILTSICAFLSASGALPEYIDATFIDETVTGLLGLATVVFRVVATQEVTVITPPAE